MGLLISFGILGLGLILINIPNNPCEWEWYGVLGVILSSIAMVGIPLVATITVFG